MKYFIFGTEEKEVTHLLDELSSYYSIGKFITNSLDEVNMIVKNNKNWIINSNSNIEILCNLSETIIYINYSKQNNSPEINNLLKKHIRKGIIIKSKKDLKKYLKSVYESSGYYEL